MTTEHPKPFHYDHKWQLYLTNQLAVLNTSGVEKLDELRQLLLEHGRVAAEFEVHQSNCQQVDAICVDAICLGNELVRLQRLMMDLEPLIREHQEKREEAEKLLEDQKALFTLELERIAVMRDSFAPKLEEMRALVVEKE